MRNTTLIVCISLFIVSATAARGEALRVGTFDVDATPPVGSPLAYDPMTGVTDRLHATGIVLLGADKPIVLCAVDWLGIANNGQVEWRAALAKAAGTTVDHVSVHVLHQHDAPRCDFSADAVLREHGHADIMFNVDFARDTIARAAAAVKRAVANAQIVTHIGLGKGTVEGVASNRRILGPDGKVIATRYTSCKDPALRALPDGIVDKELCLIAFYHDDRPIVALTYFATHPQSYYRTGTTSADFPGLAREKRYKATGVPHVHFNGAGGNIGAGKYNDGSHENRAILRDRMAAGMAEAWDNVKKQPIEAKDVRWTVERVVMPAGEHLTEATIVPRIDAENTSPLQRILAAKDLVFLRRSQARDTVDIPCLALGNARILHMPGELVVEYQLAAKRMRPDLFVTMAAYGDYAAGYVCMAHHYDEGGYEASQRASRVGPAIEPILMAAVRKLLEAK